MEKMAAERRELHNEVVDLKGAVRVFCRQRPLVEDEVARGWAAATACDEDDASIVLHTGRRAAICPIATPAPNF